MDKIQSLGYAVFFEDGNLLALNDYLKSQAYSKYFILTDDIVKDHCLLHLVKKVKVLQQADVLLIANGEENKTIETCINLWKELTDSEADRKSLLVNIGGGVISDMGGFVASTYKRGIDFINIPTTLLSMADASVGGKTGIDFGSYKNHIGTFTQPKGVFIYPGFLKTLDDRQLINGFAEVIKSALIADAGLWKKITGLKSLHPAKLNDLIHQSVQIKNSIVKKDPQEKNVRKALNFGHTIGHAVESLYLTKKGKQLLHGEAIAIGMICEAYLSYTKKLLGEKQLKEIIELILAYFPQVKLAEKEFLVLMALMQHDKKNENGKTRFTLLKGIGKFKINAEFTSFEILESLTFYNSI